jgi:hypothetical protein
MEKPYDYCKSEVITILHLPYPDTSGNNILFASRMARASPVFASSGISNFLNPSARRPVSPRTCSCPPRLRKQDSPSPPGKSLVTKSCTVNECLSAQREPPDSRGGKAMIEALSLISKIFDAVWMMRPRLEPRRGKEILAFEL